jgi:hypothetical protein
VLENTAGGWVAGGARQLSYYDLLMSNAKLLLWFRSVSVILVLFGIVYVFFGLKILPVGKRLEVVECL